MRIHLLTPVGARLPERELDPGDDDLARDLGIDDVVGAMAGGDAYLRDVARDVLLHTLDDPAAIRWRQEVLGDALAHPGAVRELYRIATEAAGAESRVRGWWISSEPSSVLGRSVAVMRALLEPLRALRRWADGHGPELESAGLRGLVEEVVRTLPEAWFGQVESHLVRLANPDVVMTAHLGPTGRGTGYVLTALEPARRSWLGRQPRSDDTTVAVPPTDTAGGQALTELRERGLRPVASALSTSSDEVLATFAQLRREAAFLAGCVALAEQLAHHGMPTTLPEVRSGGRELTARGLYDVGLAVRTRAGVVGNDLAADGRTTVVVTGANQGGKSTLLRAAGLAQVMAQAGMFAGAAGLRLSAVGRVHTHFRREEDDRLRSGKLREELVRMGAIADRAQPGDLVLSNESFASTNEREGSRIATQIVEGLVEGGVRVVMVTHLTEFSRALADEGREDVLFLRADRAPDGSRTYRVEPGAPLPTSFGMDLWRGVFGLSP